MRDGLISDAAATIAEGGPNAISLRTLAKGRGLSTTAIYTLFGSKDELITETASYAVQSFADSQESVPVGDGGYAYLDALGMAYRDWALKHRALYRLVFGGRLYDAAPTKQPQNMSAMRAIKPMQNAVGSLIADGVLEGDPQVIGVVLWSGVHGFVTLEMGPLQRVPRPARDAMFNVMLAKVARGFEPRPS